MPYENKRVKDGTHPSRAAAHDSFFTVPDKQAAAPAPFFSKKEADKENPPVQGPFTQLKAAAGGSDGKTHVPSPPKANDTGLPDGLKAGMEDLSGFSLNDVNVHYNSDRPAQLRAYAYTQGRDIHVGPGQEKHLPHEAWHVVQQKQGRVNATMQMKGVGINDDAGLEREADVMGKQAVQRGAVADGGDEGQYRNVPLTVAGAPVQRLTGFEVETNIPIYHQTDDGTATVNPEYQTGFTTEIGSFLFGGLKYGYQYGFDPEGHFSLTADHNELTAPHNKLMHLLSLSGFLKPEGRKRNIANLEYVTPPRDELGTGSRKLFQDDVEHIKTHANETLGTAKSGQSGAVRHTGNWMLTGVPAKAILTWVRQHNAPADAFETVLNEMDALITNRLYVQETTGVLPEDIPALYESGSKRMEGDKLTVATVMADFMKVAVQLGQQAYEATSLDKSSDLFGKQKGAVVGFLTYLASHLLADSLSLTNFKGSNTTDKNLFPYFPKVQLSTAFQALPEALRSEKASWNALVESLIKISSAHCLQYWQSKGLVIDKNLYESKVFREMNPYFGVSEEEEGGIVPETPSARNVFNNMIEGKVAEIHVQKNLPGLDKPHEEVMKATGGQQAIPVEDRNWNSKFKEDITTDTIEETFMTEAGAAIDRQFRHLPGSEQEKIRQGINDKPDYEGKQQQRLESKRKDIADFPTEMRDRSVNHEKLIKYHQDWAEAWEKKAATIEEILAKVKGPVEQLKEIDVEKKSILTEVKRLTEEKKSLQAKYEEGNAKPDEGTILALKKIEEDGAALKLRYAPIQEEEQLLLKSVYKDLKMTTATAAAAIAAFKKLEQDLKKSFKLAQQEKSNMQRAIENAAAFKRISESSLKFVPTEKQQELTGKEGGQSEESDLDTRILEQKKLENTWQNRLDDKDTPFSFKSAKAGLEKELKIGLAKWKKGNINLDMLKVNEVKESIQRTLEEAHAIELVISQYDSLTVTDASPQTAALLFEYMKIAGQYNEIIGRAYDMYNKAEKIKPTEDEENTD